MRVRLRAWRAELTFLMLGQPQQAWLESMSRRVAYLPSENFCFRFIELRGELNGELSLVQADLGARSARLKRSKACSQSCRQALLRVATIPESTSLSFVHSILPTTAKTRHWTVWQEGESIWRNTKGWT